MSDVVEVSCSDKYPTRVIGPPKMLNRQCPITWDKTLSGPLSKEELNQYDDKGFLLKEDLFSRDEVEKLMTNVLKLKELSKNNYDDTVVREKDSDEIRSFFAIHKNTLFSALTRDARVLGVVEQILASDAYIHQSRINLKPGFTGKEFYWHSDFETWHSEDGMPAMRALSCVINLTDNYEFNGPLMVIPGSHKLFIQCQGETPDNHYKKSLVRQDYGVPSHQHMSELVEEFGIEVPRGRAGSAVFFDCNIMHGSNGNITPYPRTNVFFVFNSTQNKLISPYAGTAPRPEIIAARNDTTTLTSL